MATSSMTMTTSSMTIYLAGGVYPDLYPWNLVLEEGFSRLYRGDLTVLSVTKHPMTDLSELLDKGISVSLSQRAGTGATLRTRYLHGIVTGVRCAGVFSDGKKEDCYSYVLTIEPELARLKFTRLSAPYYRMNPPDIFEAILKKYNLEARIEQNYISRTEYGKTLIFDQSDTSDFDFICGIAGLYGISFTFTHPPVQSKTLGAEILYFSDGYRFPRSPVVYSDSVDSVPVSKEPDTVSFDFLSAIPGTPYAARSTWKMKAWAVGQTIGFDGFTLSAAYPNANYGSEEWCWGNTEPGDRYASQRWLFHNYERGTIDDDVDADIERILEAREVAAALDKVRWTAAAENLALRPGLVLSLTHFYGNSEPDVVMTALVTGSTLRHKALWPQDFAGRPAEDEDGEVTAVEASCVDWEQEKGQAAEKRFCPAR